MARTWDTATTRVLHLPSGRLVRRRGLRRSLPDGTTSLAQLWTSMGGVEHLRCLYGLSFAAQDAELVALRVG
jgi:hypothetical protein